MPFTRAARLLVAKIAMLAIWLAAVAPLVSQAVQPDAGGLLGEVCSASAAWADASPDDGAHAQASKAPLPAPSHWLQHCLSCGLHATAQMALLPSATVVLPRVATACGQSWPQPLPLGGRDDWATAQPRAPPQAA